MRTVNAKKGSVLPIGRLGENIATVVVFDVKCWEQQFGSGMFELLNQRSGDAAAYPCIIEQDGDAVRWTVKSADVAVTGYGRCELVYRVGDLVAKSEIYTTVVGAALNGGGDAPEPWEDWVERVLAAGTAASEAKEDVDSFLETLEGGLAGQVWTKTSDGAAWADPQGGGGASSWNTLADKPFERIGENLKVVDGTLSVDTAEDVEQDNTKPITSAAVYTEVGNINALLALI